VRSAADKVFPEARLFCLCRSEGCQTLTCAWREGFTSCLLRSPPDILCTPLERAQAFRLPVFIPLHPLRQGRSIPRFLDRVGDLRVNSDKLRFLERVRTSQTRALISPCLRMPSPPSSLLSLSSLRRAELALAPSLNLSDPHYRFPF